MALLGTVEKSKLQKVAALFVQQCPIASISLACGMTIEELEALIETEEFKTTLAEKQYEEHQKQALMDQGWDAIEQLSIKSVVETLQATHDPEFALRAGMLANRAERRSKNNRTLESNVGNGSTVVIQMNQRFVQNIRQMIKLDKREDEPLPPKRQVNMLSPTQVEKLLDVTPTKEEQDTRLAAALNKLIA